MTERKEKHKQKLKERGITLIALVITIIVLLILAGVALSALMGDSGILNNAESAKKNTNLANAKEQIELATQGAILENVSETGEMTITYDNLKNELENIVGNGKYKIDPEEEADSWTVTVGEYEATVLKNGKIDKPRDTKTLAGILTTEGTTPWLPEGFSRVTKFNEGLVIANTTNGTEGLQNYVWIEVPNNIKQTITVDSSEKTINLTEATTDEEIALILKAYAGKGTEKDYTKGSSSQSFEWKDEWYDSNGLTKEGGASNLEDTAGCGLTYDKYQIAYSSMLKSIKKYGGFWLAQYEAGIAYEEGNRTSHSAITIAKANYAKDQYPYNHVYCSEAQKIANADSVEGKYTSSLPFGIQWDLVCKFLEVKEAKTYSEIATNSTWGNYINTGWTSSANSKWSSNGTSFTSGTKTKSSGAYLLTTGAIDKVKVNETEYVANPMNIYDFAGNEYEWTLEHATTGTYYPCAVRGGEYSSVSKVIQAAYRGYFSTTVGGNFYFGFRSTLY